MNKTVLGFFDEKDQAERARQELISEGLNASDIKVFSNTSDFSKSGASVENESFTDRIKHFFQHLGDWNMSDEHAGIYAEGIRRGGYVVSVTTDDMMAERAAEILDRSGAIDIDRRSQYYKETGYQGYDVNAAPLSTNESRDYKLKYQDWEKDRFANKGKEEVVPVIEEKVNIGKRAIEKGRVRVLTRVTETPVEEQVRLRDEHINVERRPVDRPINTADMAAFKEGEIELRETAEEAVVDKEARVVEEVVINKQADEHTETVRDTVRKTDVTVDRSAGGERRLAEDDLRKDAFNPTDKI